MARVIFTKTPPTESIKDINKSFLVYFLHAEPSTTGDGGAITCLIHSWWRLVQLDPLARSWWCLVPMVDLSSFLHSDAFVLDGRFCNIVSIPFIIYKLFLQHRICFPSWRRTRLEASHRVSSSGDGHCIIYKYKKTMHISDRLNKYVKINFK